jgi:excisionase family DNA binding protein
MTNPPPADVMLTSAEAMEQLGIKKTAFYKLLNSGELAAVDVSAAARKRRIGETGRRRTLRIPQSQVDAFKERNAITA